MCMCPRTPLRAIRKWETEERLTTELLCPTNDGTEAKRYTQISPVRVAGCPLPCHTAENTGFYPGLTDKLIIFKCSFVFFFSLSAQVLTIHSLGCSERHDHLRPQLKSAQHCLKTLSGLSFRNRSFKNRGVTKLWGTCFLPPHSPSSPKEGEVQPKGS